MGDTGTLLRPVRRVLDTRVASCWVIPNYGLAAKFLGSLVGIGVLAILLIISTAIGIDSDIGTFGSACCAVGR